MKMCHIALKLSNFFWYEVHKNNSPHWLTFFRRILDLPVKA